MALGADKDLAGPGLPARARSWAMAWGLMATWADRKATGEAGEGEASEAGEARNLPGEATNGAPLASESEQAERVRVKMVREGEAALSTMCEAAGATRKAERFAPEAPLLGDARNNSNLASTRASWWTVSNNSSLVACKRLRKSTSSSAASPYRTGSIWTPLSAASEGRMMRPHSCGCQEAGARTGRVTTCAATAYAVPHAAEGAHAVPSDAVRRGVPQRPGVRGRPSVARPGRPGDGGRLVECLGLLRRTTCATHPRGGEVT